jgi:small-conductance mechanosensitive channel
LADLSGTVWTLIWAAVGFAILFVITWIVRKILRSWEKRLTAKSPGLMTGYKFLQRIIIYSVIIIGSMIIVFSIFPGLGDALAGLFVAAGFGAIVLGLAAQSTLANIFAGVSLSTSQPFKLSETVRFRDELCYVEDLRLTHTVLRSWNNRRIIVPNSVMMSEVFINYSLTDATKIVPVELYISHESDLELATEIMLKAAKEHPNALKAKEEPEVFVLDVNSTGVKLRLQTRARDQDAEWLMERDLLKTIKKEFDANGIVIPYPRTHLVIDKKSLNELKELLSKEAILKNSNETSSKQDN